MKGKSFIGLPYSKLNMSKYLIQLKCIVMWMRFNCRATVTAATGLGKSIIAVIAVMKLRSKKPDLSVIVIVPTTPLKQQWVGLFKFFGITGDVYVVNTIALKDKLYSCDLLVVDECHLFTSNKFRTIFTKVKYSAILCLTATLERLDGKETVIKRYAPVCAIIPVKTAVAKGWINEVIEINVPVYLTRRETEKLASLSKQIRFYISEFSDFKIMQSCMNMGNAISYVHKQYPSLTNDQDIKDKARLIVRDAVQGNRCVKERQAFLYNLEHKVDATVELINKFNFKSIIFSQSIKFAEEVNSQLGDDAVSYHSNLESETRLVEKCKDFKTEKGVKKHCVNNPTHKARKKGDIYQAYWKVKKTIGVDTLKKERLRLFKDRRGKINTIITAKSLDQGFDAADLEFAIDASRTSNPAQHQQRRGQNGPFPINSGKPKSRDMAILSEA